MLTGKQERIRKTKWGMGGKEREREYQEKEERERGQENTRSGIVKDSTWFSIFLFLFVLLEIHLFTQDWVEQRLTFFG